MATSRIIEMLRKAIAESGTSMKRLAQETGIERMSLTRFVEGKTTLRLDIAEKLADYFDFVLVKRRGK